MTRIKRLRAELSSTELNRLAEELDIAQLTDVPLEPDKAAAYWNRYEQTHANALNSDIPTSDQCELCCREATHTGTLIVNERVYDNSSLCQFCHIPDSKLPAI